MKRISIFTIQWSRLESPCDTLGFNYHAYELPSNLTDKDTGGDPY